MAKYTAEQIADTLIHLSRERGKELTNLKLQKLLYYAQAWHLVFESRPLFDERIEAWVHGPVVPSVFRKFKRYRWDTIDCTAFPVKDDDTVEHLKLVLGAYDELTANQLERMTHNEAPWQDARKGIPFDEPSNNAIEQAAMRKFFATLANSD